ncbi:hypothetical protein V5799_021069 [Amblyomma americanum]|uniref:Uncharacterized protein n=1 Tax=Amblyomma americanum TaxID=6943 RepID=A0AAQ4FPX3_AMBAM
MHPLLKKKKKETIRYPTPHAAPPSPWGQQRHSRPFSRNGLGSPHRAADAGRAAHFDRATQSNAMPHRGKSRAGACAEASSLLRGCGRSARDSRQPRHRFARRCCLCTWRDPDLTTSNRDWGATCTVVYGVRYFFNVTEGRSE